jgi:hypothetical protein
MMKNVRTVLTAAVLSSTMFLGTASAQDAQTCQPGLGAAFAAHAANYSALIQAMFVGVPAATTLTTDLAAVHDEPTYATLLADSQAMAAKIATGRVVVTVPDGTVMIDTSKNNNTLANFQAKAINENHNSRVAIVAAQQYPCGIGLERKLSTTDGTVETYLAFRAGTHLDSLGTLRISTKQ